MFILLLITVKVRRAVIGPLTEAASVSLATIGQLTEAAPSILGHDRDN